MIKTFTIEHFKRLEPYKVHLTRALYGNYVYALTRPIFNELSAVYKELGYTKRLDFSCSSCLLNLCKTLGSYYFPFKEKLKEEDDLAEEELEKLGDEINKVIVEDMENNDNTEPQKKTVAKSTTATKKTAQKGQKTTGRRTAAKK